MTVAMNASLNFSTYDGWVCEFARHGENAFLVPVASETNRDFEDITNMFDVLENEILPMYYERRKDWYTTVLQSMNDVGDYFNSDRMAREYYERVYK